MESTTLSTMTDNRATDGPVGGNLFHLLGGAAPPQWPGNLAWGDALANQQMITAFAECLLDDRKRAAARTGEDPLEMEDEESRESSPALPRESLHEQYLKLGLPDSITIDDLRLLELRKLDKLLPDRYKPKKSKKDPPNCRPILMGVRHRLQQKYYIRKDKRGKKAQHPCPCTCGCPLCEHCLFRHRG